MAQWQLITTSILVCCELMWNFLRGIPARLARRVSEWSGQEAQADAMYCGNASTRNNFQSYDSMRRVNPIFLCLIGIGTLHPVVVVFAAERCPATAATRVVSVQGNVTWSLINATAQQAAKLNDSLCVGDTVRVGAKSRAVLRLPNETTVPLDQNTIFRLKEAISDKEPTLIELIQGAIHVITRTPKPFRVDTPYLNALVEGTEFYVGVDNTEARVAVIEGKVNVSNEQGAVLLTDNEAASARKGQAPQKTLTIKPRDAVQWALYYPPLFDPRSRAGGENLAASHERFSQGDITGAIESLDAIPEAQRNGDYATYRAGLLLLVGRADEAEPDIERALAENGNNTDALSLKAIIAIVKNDKAKALELANQAVSIDDKSASARIALSYALQANFKIEDALKAAREATLRDATNALAWARVAELELSIPNYDKSKEAAEKAVKLNPNLARTQSILGFANLTRIDIKAAKESFNQAITLDQADPLPRLGLGLATIREGGLTEGREQIEIATSLDPENSLIRSYLGKAYYDEKKDELAGKQFELAKERDPKDPTPWLFNAISTQIYDPIASLRHLRETQWRSDYRATVRSKFLLEVDLATTSALATNTYRVLGFDQLARIDGLRSVDANPSNHAAHRFLSDFYVSVPRQEIARDSELLQGQLLQPVSANPVVPHLSGDSRVFLFDTTLNRAGLNEYAAAYQADSANIKLDSVVGSRGTRAENLVISGLWNKLSYSVGYFGYETNGFRQNEDRNQRIANGFFQFEPISAFSVLAEYRDLHEVSGDTSRFFFDDQEYSPEFRLKFQPRIFRIGGRLNFTPTSTLLFVGSTADQETNGNVGTDFVFRSKEKTRFAESRYLFQSSQFSFTLGAGHLRGTDRSKQDFGPVTILDDEFKTTHKNAYAYGTIIPRQEVTLNFGLSWDGYDDIEFNIRQFNPKLGITWEPRKGLQFRAVTLRTLKRRVISSQTLEPTQVSGFGQFYDDTNGTDSRLMGIGVDGAIGEHLFVGVESTSRKLKRGIGIQSNINDDHFQENSTKVYAYFIATSRLALSLNYQFDHFRGNPQGANSFRTENSKTHRFQTELKIFPSTNWSMALTATYRNQRGIFGFNDLQEGKDDGVTVDAGILYQWRNPQGFVALQLRNIFDESFRFQEADPSSTEFARGRILLGRLGIRF